MSMKMHHYTFTVHAEEPSGDTSIEIYTVAAYDLLSAFVCLVHDVRQPLKNMRRIDIVHDHDVSSDDPFRIVAPREPRTSRED